MIIPIVLGAFFLGGAFDFHHLQANRYEIYEKAAIERNMEAIRIPDVKTSWKVAKTYTDVQEFLDIHPYIALKAKYGELKDMPVYGQYMQQKITRNDTVEVLGLLNVKTVRKTFDYYNTKLGYGWQKRPEEQVGTHFVKAIEYGGVLLVSVQFRVYNPEDYNTVLDVVKSNMYGKRSQIPNFEGMMNEISDMAEVKITTEATPEIGHYNPTDFESIRAAFEDFPKDVRRFQGGEGVPVYVELVEINKVYPQFQPFKVNKKLLKKLHDFENYYEDLRVTMKAFENWEKEHTHIPAEKTKRVFDFERRIKAALHAFKRTIASLEMTESDKQLEEAFKLYWMGGKNEDWKYWMEFQRLEQYVDGTWKESRIRKVIKKVWSFLTLPDEHEISH